MLSFFLVLVFFIVLLAEVLAVIAVAVFELDFFAIDADGFELLLGLGVLLIPISRLESLFDVIQSQVSRDLLDSLVFQRFQEMRSLVRWVQLQVLVSCHLYRCRPFQRHGVRKVKCLLLPVALRFYESGLFLLPCLGFRIVELQHIFIIFVVLVLALSFACRFLLNLTALFRFQVLNLIVLGLWHLLS